VDTVSSEKSTTETPTVDAGLYDIVVEAAANRDAAKAENRADYDSSMERLKEVREGLAVERRELERRVRAEQVARSAVERAYQARNTDADNAYKVAVFGAEQAPSVSHYDAFGEYA